MERTIVGIQRAQRATSTAVGKFRYSTSQKKWYCEECFPIFTVANVGKNLWDFTTTHPTGERIHITSLRHMRQVEKDYGVSNHAANYMERHWDTPPPVKPHPKVDYGFPIIPVGPSDGGGWRERKD